MKKSLMILASVALGASMATAEEVTSKNVVGFITLTNVNAGSFTPIGVNFESTVSNQVSMQDLFKADELYGATTEIEGDLYPVYASSDQALFWNGATYLTFVYDGTISQWTDLGGTPMTNYLSKGDAFFYKRSSSSPETSLTFAGQVGTVTNFVHSLIEQGFQPIAMAYPIEKSVNAAGLNGYGATTEIEGDLYPVYANSDQLLFWNGATYLTYVYDGTISQWTDLGGTPMTQSIPLGKAVFYKRYHASDLTWNEVK